MFALNDDKEPGPVLGCIYVLYWKLTFRAHFQTINDTRATAIETDAEGVPYSHTPSRRTRAFQISNKIPFECRNMDQIAISNKISTQ